MSEGTSAVVEHPNRLVEITVNNKPVTVPGPRITGIEIKQAAISQGVPIELDFQLAEVLAHGETKIIADNNVVTVDKKSKFVATAPDDNS